MNLRTNPTKPRNLIADYILLSVPLTHGPFVILCDASNLAIGAVLCQWDNDHLNILEFASKKFNDSEKNWSVQEKEAFAIKWSVSKWEDYLKGAKVFVFTDHASLQWIGTSNTGKVQRWALFLQQFDITVRAISGKDNGMADWLSRSTHDLTVLIDQEIDSMSIPVYTFIEEDKSNRKIQMNPYLPTYSQWVDSSKEIPEEDKKYLKLGNNKLYYSIRGMKLYVPPNLRESIMYYFHASKYGGHHGIRKTLRRIII